MTKKKQVKKIRKPEYGTTAKNLFGYGFFMLR